MRGGRCDGGVAYNIECLRRSSDKPQLVSPLTPRGGVLGGVVAFKVVWGGCEKTFRDVRLVRITRGRLQVNQEDLGAAPERLRWLH